MKVLLMIFSFLLLLLIIGLWFGQSSMPKRWQLQQEVDNLKSETTRQTDINQSIKAEIDDAKSGSEAIEERARSELGMTEKDETFFRVIMKPSDADTDKQQSQITDLPKNSVNESNKK